MPSIKLTVLLLLTCSCAFGQVQLGESFSGLLANDNLGADVAISADGNRIAIGTTGSDILANNGGTVQAYQYDGSTWLTMGDAFNGPESTDLLGWQVDFSDDGNILAMSGLNMGVGAIFNAGIIQIFQWNGSSWDQLGDGILGEAADDQSGVSIDLASDGMTVIIGAQKNDDGGSNAGHARVYNWDGSSWNQKGDDLDGQNANDAYGTAVTISTDGNRIAVAAPSYSGITGLVQIFEWSGTEWVQLGSDLEGLAQNTAFGRSLDLSADGNTIAIGTPGFSSGKGSVSFFSWNGAEWASSFPQITGTVNGGQAGVALRLSPDASKIVVGAPEVNNGRGTSTLYRLEGNSWVIQEAAVFGEGSGSECGEAVDISADGETIVVGERFHGNAGQGRVRVFDMSVATTTNVAHKPSLSISPNPFSDYITLESDHSFTKLEVFDIRGQAVCSIEVSGERISLAALSAGTYFLRLRSPIHTSTFTKVVKL